MHTSYNEEALNSKSSENEQIDLIFKTLMDFMSLNMEFSPRNIVFYKLTSHQKC